MPDEITISDLKIFIDPGHGGPVERADISGSQLGTTGYHGHFAPEDVIYEKDINLEISLILRDLLIAENVTVGMSRETDIPLSLMDRVRMSNNFGADIFISIHNNATHDPDTGGTMVLFPAKDIRAQNLAAIISAEISNRLGTRNIGAIERNDVLVVREPKATSVLVEAVFMTNPEEEQMIIQQENQILVAEAIIAALKIHIQEFQEFYKRRPLITRPSFLVPALGLIGGGIYHYFRREG